MDRVSAGSIVSIASDIVRIPSFKTEETALAMWLAEFFSSKGYEVDLQEVEEGRYQTIARLKGVGDGRSLMFNGHIDIDPLARGWKGDPFAPRVSDGYLFGAGLENMKGGVASMIAAAECIRTSGVQLRGDLVLACVAGELQGGVGTVHMLQSGLRTDMAVVTEPMGTQNVTLVHSGWSQLAISTIGFSTHVTVKDGAVDAIAMMRRLIPVLEATEFTCDRRADMPALPILTVGAIIGGRGEEHDLKGPNFVSDYCTILVDVRFLPDQTPQTVYDDIVRSLNRLREDDPSFEFEIEQPPGPRYRAQRVQMPALQVPESEEIVQTVIRHAREVLGREPTVGLNLPLSYGGDDTCHLWEAGIPCLLYGPGGVEPTPELPDHSIEIEEMVRATKVLALTALDVCDIAGSTPGDL
nr:M20/M25/M40 family metallo-hydrolase [Nocardioides agariphilus]